MEKALEELRELYNARGCPTIDQVSRAADLSPSTVQRYLSGPIKRADYAKVIAIRKALCEDEDISSDDVDPDIVRQIDDTDQLQALVLELRQINLAEINTTRSGLNAEWKQRMETNAQSHREELGRLERSHDRERELLQKTQLEQLHALREMCDAQKRADEHSKVYLKRQILFWRVCTLVLMAVIILLFILDLRNPSKGWLRMLGNILSTRSSVS